MKRILSTLLLFLIIAPVNAFANPIDAVSGRQVGLNAYDMNGMEITVTLANGSTETVDFINNSAEGAGWAIGNGWKLDFTGTNTGSDDWVLNASGSGIQNITINAYAEGRLVFDIINRYGNYVAPPTDPSTADPNKYSNDNKIWDPTNPGYLFWYHGT